MGAVFALEGVDKHFGGVHAVADVTLRVERGRVHGLIGPNGAGKTTLVNIAAGLVRPDRGRVQLNDTDITGRPVYRRARNGLSRTFQSARLFEQMSVRQNLQITSGRGGKGPSDVDALLAQLQMADVADHLASDLPHGRRKLLEVARAFAGEPTVVLLDEPAAGMDVVETEILLALVEAHSSTMGVMLIEHQMDVVTAVCEELTVMDAGAVLKHGDPEDVLVDKSVVQAYLGVS